ncbi:helix-turn-helix domain-containing protein [Azospirillum brasilense]|uniref:helix-turn-helix domain-containing protein n=1 Tax=Azospirillum brasilense TaxID=192 RepID=UPI00157B893D|nr:helix-turn-helix transcriptional regulator [Azospirillum brasilense]
MAETFAPNRIRELRKAKRLTLHQLADAVTARGRVQMHHTYLTKIENRQRRLTDDVRDEIAAVLEVDPGSLVLPSNGPLMKEVPLIRWSELTAALRGRFPPDVQHVGAATQSEHPIALRIPKHATMLLGPENRGAIGIVDLDDADVRDGWWIGQIDREVTLLLRDGGEWTDDLVEDEPKPNVPNGTVSVIGRLIGYHVSLEDSDGGEHVEVDAAEEDEKSDQEPDHDPAFLKKVRK